MIRRFTVREEPFVCEACNAPVEPLGGVTCRDHCPVCLWGKHLDRLPGDRASGCDGALEPIGLDGTGDRQQLVYRCSRCGEIRRNRLAPDDDPTAVVELSTRPLSMRRR